MPCHGKSKFALKSDKVKFKAGEKSEFRVSGKSLRLK